MNFISLEFALFLGLVLVINWSFKGGPAYPRFLLAANLIFYGLGAPKFLPLLILVGLATWVTVHLMAVKPEFKKLLLVLDIIFSLGLLVFFKYFELLITTLDSLGLLPPSSPLFRLPEIVYPVGLSFFTFQGLSLTIDQYRDPDPEPPTLTKVLAFVSFFPTVLAGPIQRWRNFIPQLARRRSDPEALNLGLWLIVAGLFKKVALSSYLSENIVRGVFQVPESYSFLGVLGGIYGYSAQIYLDFSGYSDLAQGVAALMGLEVGANFKSPYLVTNIRDFWRRWHISLSTWLRDYLYIPLGGSRRGFKPLNLLIVQTLGGLWHGAHLRYLVWGLAHGLALALYHLIRDLAPKAPSPPKAKVKGLGKTLVKAKVKGKAGAKGVKRPTAPALEVKPRPVWLGRLLKWGGFLLTFNFVSFTWILFRAEDFNRALEIAQAALDWSRPGQGAPLMVWLIGALTLAGQAYGHWIQKLALKFQSRLSTPALGLWLALLAIIIIKLGPKGVLPFIYFQY